MEYTFLLKKVISFFLMPLPIAMALILMVLWFIYKKQIKKATIYTSITFLWILLISSSPVANFLMKPLVQSYHQLKKIPNNVQYILLLGGDREHRAWEAIRLYQQNKNLKIITSGYSLIGASDAQITAKMLEDAGVKKEQIFSQNKAKDTKEEAIALKKRIKNKPFILVTSAYHMPRAMKLFQKEGLNPIPAPCNDDYLYDKSIIHAKQIRKTEQALHEYIGLLWLKLKG
jgi:uncharacterized SAM-binding protein YcdF (DUF218 family)